LNGLDAPFGQQLKDRAAADSEELGGGLDAVEQRLSDG
jgi:hypothetical protein